MNRHLNLFKPFSQNLSKENIEDNLSRALVLCLQNNSLLFHEFLRTIFFETGQIQLYHNLLSDITAKDSYTVDIQVETTEIDGSFSKVFALTISGIPLEMKYFRDPKEIQEKKHRTDVFISINDIAIVIEVKRDNTDCRDQLYQQVAAFTEYIDEQTVYPLDFNWPKLMRLINQVDGFQTLIESGDKQFKDFIDLVQTYNPNWIPIAPLASLKNNNLSEGKINQRLTAALKYIDSEAHPILRYNDRIGLQLNFGWAREILLYLSGREDGKLNLIFSIWPGNTKGQGTQMLRLLAKHENWNPPSNIEIDSKIFDVDSGYELKFCHFNRYVNNLILSNKEIKEGKQLISSDVHWNYTGKYLRSEWHKVDKFIDEYTVESYDWKSKLGWTSNFEETNRNYLTISAGYFMETVVPVSYLQGLDTSIENLEPLANFILKIKENYKNLFQKG